MPSKDLTARRNPAIAGCTATGVLKILALVFMFIDHAGKMLFPQIAEMRMLGRIAFPLYCWCMVVGISYTRSVPKYLGRLMLIGLVSQPIYMVALNHSWNQPNIFLTLLVALCGVRGSRAGIACVMIAFCLYWGGSSVGVTHLFGQDVTPLTSSAVGTVISPWLRLQTMAIWALPLMLLPISQQVKMPRWVGYALYPLHLVVLIALEAALAQPIHTENLINAWNAFVSLF